jgi:hypothetical protein
LARLQLWRQLSGFACRLDGQLRSNGGRPAYWAEDVRRVLNVLRDALPAPLYPVPGDLAEVVGEDEARSLGQRLVRRFGQLLQAWPDMVQAARDLRARGLRPAGRL